MEEILFHDVFSEPVNITRILHCSKSDRGAIFETLLANTMNLMKAVSEESVQIDP
jgi:hypothetical protein